MPKHLTDKQQQQIVADFISSGDSYREIAKRYGVAPNTIKNVVSKNADVAQRCAEKKEETTYDLLAEMQADSRFAHNLHKMALNRAKELIPKTTDIQRLMTAMGIMIDKQTKYIEMQQRQAEIDLRAREVAAKEDKGESEDMLKESLKQLQEMVDIVRQPLPPHKLP